MSDTDRLAALLHDELLHDDVHNPVDEPECHIIAARLIAQGVRVGDDGLTVLDAWRVLEREYPEATVARLRAALAAQPAPPPSFVEGFATTADIAVNLAQPAPPALDRERLARAIHERFCDFGFDTCAEDSAAIADAYEAVR